MVLSSWHSHCESSPGSFDECRLSTGWPRTLRPNQLIWAVSPLIGCYHPQTPSPFIIMSQLWLQHPFICLCQHTVFFQAVHVTVHVCIRIHVLKVCWHDLVGISPNLQLWCSLEQRWTGFDFEVEGHGHSKTNALFQQRHTDPRFAILNNL